MPDELINTSKNVRRVYHIVRVHDGVVDVLAESTDANITFETDKFSTFAITYQDQDVTIDVPKTGDNIQSAFLIMLILACAMSLLTAIIFKKKKRVN